MFLGFTASKLKIHRKCLELSGRITIRRPIAYILQHLFWLGKREQTFGSFNSVSPSTIYEFLRRSNSSGFITHNQFNQFNYYYAEINFYVIYCHIGICFWELAFDIPTQHFKKCLYVKVLLLSLWKEALSC